MSEPFAAVFLRSLSISSDPSALYSRVQMHLPNINLSGISYWKIQLLSRIPITRIPTFGAPTGNQHMSTSVCEEKEERDREKQEGERSGGDCNGVMVVCRWVVTEGKGN